MTKLLLSLTLLGSLLGGFRDLYCPECERFAADEWSIDAKGLCRGCGRAPVAVEAAARRWFWCESQAEWRDDPCSFARARGCCTEWTSTALIQLPPEATLRRAAFCPADRSFRGFEADAEGRDRCRTCGRTAATADAADVVWYWCRAERRWGPEPCPQDRTGKCCDARATTVPVLWLAPMPRPISFEEPPGVLASTDWLAAHLDDLDLVVLHVEGAERASFDDGHVPFARRLPWTALAVERDGLPNEFPPAAETAEALRRAGVDAHHRLVVYDAGAGLEAARAFVALEYLGFAGRVSLLDGQWKAWVREGREVSRAESAVEPTGFVPTVYADVLADRREVEDVVWTALEPAPTAVLLDARSAAEYAGLEPGKGIRRPGHLPGAMCLPWTSMLVSREDPAFRSEEELRAQFEAKGARPGRRVLTYCRSGVQASLLYVAARRLGYAASLYDGSYADWSARPELPVESTFTLR